MSSGETLLSSIFVQNIETLTAWNEDRDPNEKKKFKMFLSLIHRYLRNPDFRTLTSSAPTGNRTETHFDLDFEESLDELFECNHQNEGLDKWVKTSSRPFVKGAPSVPESSKTGSSYTRFSDLTKTTVKSSSMGNAYLTDFKYHKRAIAVNRRRWNPRFTHNPSTISSPIFPPSVSSIHRSHSHHVFQRWDDNILLGIFRKDKLTAVREFIASLSDTNAELCMSVIRSMHAQRIFSHYNTSSATM